MGPSTQGGNIFFAKYGCPSGGSLLSGGGNHYFSCNNEALPCCGRGPSCQPLHVQSTSDGSRSLTMLTTPRREHQGDGRRRGLGRGRHGAGEDVAVEARVERSTRVHWFGCDVRLPSPQGLASGGNCRGQRGLCGSTAGHGRQEHATRPALLWAAGARRPEVEEALRPLDGHRTVTGARIIHID